MFDKILIANRGEIACRIARTCRRLGVTTVAVYSEADAHAQHVLLADEAYPIGGPRPNESYLRQDAILEVAQKAGAQAIHPGYGFLSERPQLPRACAEHGIAFIGPSAESIEAMGSKSDAKRLMERAGVPVVPGYHAVEQSAEHLRQQAETIGFPLMIKPAAGGGGKGMRIVRRGEDFADALDAACREAENAFGDATVILERYLEYPRHIEIQVFGDSHGNHLHLFERECSVQRRYQKIIEETPSPFLDADLRARMGAAAVDAARAVDYVGAGTVEFIVDRDGSFYFMEMNTRLQVEHPVTEQVTGLDLVEWQLRVAAGEPLPLTQDAIVQHGHAIEARLYAEDPDKGFLPSTGTLERLSFPAESRHVRVDTGVSQGDTVTVFYDPMIAKLIVWDESRRLAINRLRHALHDTRIAGPTSNLAFLTRLLDDPHFVAGTVDTGYLDRHLSEVLGSDDDPPELAVVAAAVQHLLDEESAARTRALATDDPASPWARADGWRLGHAGRRLVSLLHGERRLELAAYGSDGTYTLADDQQQWSVAWSRADERSLAVALDDRVYRVPRISDPPECEILLDPGRYRFTAVDPFHLGATGPSSENSVHSPMPGRVVAVKVGEGQAVSEGDEVVIMEAMKMEITLRAPQDGTVERVLHQAGDFVESDVALVAFAEPGED